LVLSAGTRLGSYEILSPLGAGGIGEVYKARDARLEREVAVKVRPAGRKSECDGYRRLYQELQTSRGSDSRSQPG